MLVNVPTVDRKQDILIFDHFQDSVQIISTTGSVQSRLGDLIEENRSSLSLHGVFAPAPVPQSVLAVNNKRRRKK